MSTNTANIKAKFLSLALFLFVTACGGGGGGGGGGTPAAAVIVPRFAYVANNGDNTVSIYTVNASTGQLRHNGYVAAGTGPVSVSVDPSGKFAYVANFSSGNLSAFSLNATPGALTAVGSPVAAGATPLSLTLP